MSINAIKTQFPEEKTNLVKAAVFLFMIMKGTRARGLLKYL